ncbi:MAG: PEP-CTERM sorting domain-containing protein [Acidobacteria bacterium]|nr:PEP-CTERM sorting domain-containing protein [Acidobacteriota bacterium]
MRSLRSGVLLALSICWPAGAAYITIADHSADYTEVVAPAGWAYQWSTAANIGTGSYTNLLWNSSGFPDVPAGPRFAFSASGSWPWDGRYTYIRQLTMNVGQPGEFTILAYTVQPGEAGPSLFHGTFAGDDPLGENGNSDGWDLRVYVNNNLIAQIAYGWTMSVLPLDYDLGTLVVGDQVILAMGAGANNLFDRGAMTMQVLTDVPEPSTFALAAAGAAALALLRRMKKP